MLLQSVEDKKFASDVAAIAKGFRNENERREFDLTMQILLKGEITDVKVARTMAKNWIAEYNKLK